MGSRKYLAVCIFLFGFSQVASANKTALSKQFSACMDKSGGVTVNMLDCIASETKGQDAHLNKAYKEVMGQLTPARKEQLQEAQRFWLKYRDANCTFYADPDGGTIATVSASYCFMSTTAARAKEIETFKE